MTPNFGEMLHIMGDCRLVQSWDVICQYLVKFKLSYGSAIVLPIYWESAPVNTRHACWGEDTSMLIVFFVLQKSGGKPALE